MPTTPARPARRLVAASAAAALAATALSLATPITAAADSSKGSRSAATRILGTPRSGLDWHSGAWTGGRFTTGTINSFGSWRGRPADVVTTYAPRDSYQSIKDDEWSITTWNGFSGRLSYGLAPLPDNGEGSLRSIGAGQQDAVWREVARDLKSAGRGNSIIRVAWESNLRNWRHHATAANAREFKAAYRRIATTMRAEAPGLLFEFGINCGTGLTGSTDRLAPLTELYPGDDVVDLVGCDTYDWWDTQASNDAEWSRVLTPAHGPGIKDVADFARARGKGASYAEWGLARHSNGGGGGDNPYYVEAMHGFFEANRDVVAFECYFDEPAGYIANSLFGTSQNPRSADRYAELW